ncbi:PPOX class F420-dependent oxidoreductase [Actinocrispum sp. NPDC049592]|uniref:PPOX class F420-dependent oxidoreductase n=1 Tax=Actinocrispum sp. NPDC049592 TaxID=3154835 RepID=UPI0034493BC3
MITKEWREFLLTGTRTGKLAVVRKNGLPHVTPIWFLLDDNDELVFTTYGKSVKARALLRTKAFTLCVDDQTPPFSYAMLECTIRSMETGDPGKLAWATRIGARYMGADQAEAYGKRNSVPEEYLVRAEVTKIVAQANIAG